MKTQRFVRVMTEKVAGFSTVRALGFGLLIQTVILGALYAIINSARVHSIIGGRELGQEDFALSIVISMGFVLYGVYRRKQDFIKKTIKLSE